MDILKEYENILNDLEASIVNEDIHEDAELFEYQDFVKSKLKENNIKSISEMSYTQKQRFFAEAEKEWKVKKAKVIDTNLKDAGGKKISNEPKETKIKKTSKNISECDYKRDVNIAESANNVKSVKKINEEIEKIEKLLQKDRKDRDSKRVPNNNKK